MTGYSGAALFAAIRGRHAEMHYNITEGDDISVWTRFC